MIAPTITWRVNGSVHNPNNRFQVVLFDSYNNLIWESPILESELIAYNETYTYAIPNSDWRKIVDECSGITTFNIAVRAYHSDEPISGPYMSHIITIQITSPTEASATFFTYTRYIEKCLRLDKGETFEYHITFQTAGQKIIQTFGPKDTILDLYSTDGTLLATNDDSGYSFNAFITCDVDANVQYTIRIRFFSTNVYGTTKLAIFAAKKLQADVTQSLTRYEDFFCFKNTSNHTMNGYIVRARQKQPIWAQLKSPI